MGAASSPVRAEQKTLPRPYRAFQFPIATRGSAKALHQNYGHEKESILQKSALMFSITYRRKIADFSIFSHDLCSIRRVAGIPSMAASLRTPRASSSIPFIPDSEVGRIAARPEGPPGIVHNDSEIGLTFLTQLRVRVYCF
jgi:hypothetical protein